MIKSELKNKTKCCDWDILVVVACMRACVCVCLKTNGLSLPTQTQNLEV